MARYPCCPERCPDQRVGSVDPGAVCRRIETPTLTPEFARLLAQLDERVEEDAKLGRYLSQIQPLGRDIAQAKSEGVRIMTMTGSKGLTVRATILAALEDQVLPRPNADLSEERRVLYVAMTRSQEFLFATWAGNRKGPTARSATATLNFRQHSHFLNGGPVSSQDGEAFLGERWPCT